MAGLDWRQRRRRSAVVAGRCGLQTRVKPFREGPIRHQYCQSIFMHCTLNEVSIAGRGRATLRRAWCNQNTEGLGTPAMFGTQEETIAMINFNPLTRRAILGNVAKAAGAITFATGLGSNAARAVIDPSKFLSNGKISFGVILPLSGAFTIVSQPWIRACQYAVEEINKAGGVKVGGKSYEVDTPLGDEQYTAAGGLSAFKKLTADGVHFSTGYISVEAQTAVQALNAANDHLLVTNIPSSDLNLTEDNLRLQAYGLSQATGPYLADYVFNVLNARKVGSIELGNAWGANVFGSFASTFKELGGEMVQRNEMGVNQTDYSANITEMAAKKVDLLYIIIGDGPGTTIALQAREGGLADVPIIGEGVWGPEMFKDEASIKAIDGAIFAGQRPYVTWDAKHTELDARLMKDINLHLNWPFWWGYDPTKVVLWSMEEANSFDPRDVIRAIPEVVKKRAGELLIAPQGSITTKTRGVFLKIPMWVARFDGHADFSKQSSLTPVKEEKYGGFPGWMPENWDGYTAKLGDKNANWYPTLAQLEAMRKAAGEDMTRAKL
jgi:branched-chain amino acid transport system substrate-binding protein